MESLLDLFWLLALVLAAAKLAGAAASRLGQPAVLGELLAGLILGPTVLDILHAPFLAPASRATAEVVRALAEIGVILLLFLAGMETDLAALRRVGGAAVGGAVGGIVLPLGGGYLLSRAFGLPAGESWFIGATLTATSVSISAQTLLELGRLRSREGTTIMGAAIIDDVLGILVLSLVVAFAGGAAGAEGAAGGGPNLPLLVGRIVIFFAAGWIVGRRFFERWARRAEKLAVAEPVLTLAVILALAYSWAAEVVGGMAAITGAYLAGLSFGQTTFRELLEHRVQHLAYGFFAPIFFASIGLEANARELGASLGFALVVIAVAVLSKALGAGLGTLPGGFSVAEATRVGVGMVSRGEVGLIVASVGLAAGVVERPIFSVMVLMTVVTTLVTPVLLRWAFAGKAGEPEARPSG